MPEFDPTPHDVPLPPVDGTFEVIPASPLDGPLPAMDYLPGVSTTAPEAQPADAEPDYLIGAAFLHSRNNRLHANSEVETVVDYMRATQRILNDPVQKIAAYLSFMADPAYGNDPIMTGDPEGIEAEVKARTLQAGELPDGYFETQRRFAREQGYGNIDITPDLRTAAASVVAGDQQASLHEWATYITGNDAYAPWFRRYVFDSVAKMGKFNPEQGKYGRYQVRSRATAAPYPGLIRGALSRVHSWMHDHLEAGKAPDTITAGLPDDGFDDKRREDFRRALIKGDFAALYVHALHVNKTGCITAEQRKRLDGNWRRYDQNSDPRALYDDLQGYGLDWCTATGFATTKLYVENGDFYVYYTPDDAGRQVVPRVAIRMERGEVAEVRGIDPKQELEPSLADMVARKAERLPGGVAYVQKAADMKRVTAIEQAVTADPGSTLSQADVRFLYEIDRPIMNFGYDRDPRIREIQRMRGNLDHSVMHELLPGVIREQLPGAMQGYDDVMRILEGLRLGPGMWLPSYEHCTPPELMRLYEYTHRDWQEAGVYDYVAKQLLDHGIRYRLLVTPNIAISLLHLRELYEHFPNRLGMCDMPPLYSYANEEVSGSHGPNPARFSLIPNRPEPDGLGLFSAERQRRMLSRMQAEAPQLNMHVPSMFDVVALAYTNLFHTGHDTHWHNVPNIRHVDLLPYKGRIGWVLPESSIVNGNPTLSHNWPQASVPLYVAVE